MANLPRQQVDKIVVGTFDTSQEIDTKDQSPTGTLVANGPAVFGNMEPFGNNYDAVLNVSSNSCEQIPFDQQPKLDVNLAVSTDGNVRIIGDKKTDNALFVAGGKGPDVLFVTGDATFTGAVDCGNKGALAARFELADDRPKPFDIKHPTKGEGHRLRYACIEGPEVGVYCRGRLKGKNIIELPYYWKDLVHEDSITVQLQPIGKSQNLVIESFNSEYVVIEIGANQDFLTNEILIDCFYHVYAERKDINPLIVEYEGDSWKDYPDPNYNPDKVDTNERSYNDPRFAGPPNTITS